MKKYFSFSTLLFLLFLSMQAFAQTDSTLLGEYKYVPVSLTEGIWWRLQGKKKYLSSTKVNLKKDASFSFSTCGCQTTGTYRVQKDTILLKHLEVSTDIPTRKCSLPSQYLIDAKRRLIGLNKDIRIEILTKQTVAQGS